MSMYKKLGIIALVLIIIGILTIKVFGLSITKQKIEELQVEEQTNTEAINNLTIKQDALHNLANVLRDIDPVKNEALLTTLGSEWMLTQTEKNTLVERNATITEEVTVLQQQDAEEQRWAQKEQEYPTATYIWRYLKEQGYNDYVCAGILGNMMAETGGHTLNIKWDIYGGNYYGICQWSGTYSTIHGGNLQQQCEYLSKTIKNEIDNFGFNYYRGFNYDAFLNLQDCSSAAIAFAKCYERCASAYVNIRATNAQKAYNYFVN